MKKLMLILAVLLIAAPAMAAVTLSLDNNNNADGLVSINYTSTGSLPRAFALNVSVDEGTITGYTAWTPGNANGCQPYRIYMGNIVIENGVITGYGSPVAPASAPDAPGQLPSASIVIEMGSLYDAAIPSNPEKPAVSGTLIKLQCSSTATTCDMTVTSNALRGKIVNEDTTVEDRSVTGAVNAAGCPGVGAASMAQYLAVGSPASWCNNARQCHGDANGAENGGTKLGYFWVQEADMGILVAGWKKDAKAYGDYTPAIDPTGWIAADFSRTENGGTKLGYFRVQESDLGILVNYWKKDAKAQGADAAVPADCQ